MPTGPKPPSSDHYIGRFAPSPTGPLHFGSLVSALASFLDARAQQGRWLLRMEDLDPPREVPGAADSILRSLDEHGLHWDEQVLYQSSRLEAYQVLINSLRAHQLAYECDCSRARISQLQGIYDGHCKTRTEVGSPRATRLRIEEHSTQSFQDLVQGPYSQDLNQDLGDFIILRKDGLVAYQLAVVADDIEQGITHIIRGSDLLDSSPRQAYLFQVLKSATPYFGHIPVVANADGQKLSKQNHAPALNTQGAAHNLWTALEFLQQSPPIELRSASVEEMIEWGVLHWQLESIPARLQQPNPTGGQ
jgi:glutamyl-Q tRNA(Asp) synthetase